MSVIRPPVKALPASFGALGFVTPDQARKVPGRKVRRLLIATEGPSDTGKTEFLLTCPGPGLILACDRGFDATFDNPKPPSTRRSDFGVRVMKMPSATQFRDAKDYLTYWVEYLKTLLAALENPDAITVAVDGDNVTWEVQRLAEHGKLTGVFPQTKYTDVYAARRALYFRCWEAGKIVVMTNMMRDEFVDMRDADGNIVIDPSTNEAKRMKTGNKVAAGFPDQEYLWQVRVRHLYTPPTPPTWNKTLKRNLGGQPAQWGLKITKCKANPEVVGQELWGPDATFAGLTATCYPHIDPKEWGL